MRVPLSWLRDVVDLPAAETGRTVADRLVRAGLEVETVDEVGADLTGPLVVGRVLAYEEETHRNGKTIRWCQVDVGEDAARGIVCGARNFAVGDLVVVALPEAVLPGGFAISARSTYGHVSDGMICSVRELGIGDDHTGILVLPPESAEPGLDAVPLLGLRDDVLDVAVTPDRGYALSLRGIGRETATAYGLSYQDPAEVSVLSPSAAPGGWPVRLDDPSGCPLFVARTVTGVDPAAPSPAWLQQRLRLAGMRPISVVVDVTNYVMLELGQPLHAYDRDRLRGTIVVRRSSPGERLRTLDGTERVLDPEDLLITDDSGPIGLAGVMGGASTEVSTSTVDVVVEAAHFDPVSISRTARRHKLPSEASRRFERVVDPALPPQAAQRAVDLLVQLAGGTAEAGTVEGSVPAPVAIALAVDLPGRVVGAAYPPDEVVRHLTAVGAAVGGPGATLTVTPPSWRPDLTDPYDLVEEVARLGGYERIPARLPRATSGRGLTERQRLRRRVGRALAAAGYVEAPNPPFVGPADWDALLLPADDPRRRAHRLVNPLADTEPLLRTTLLPGLLRTLARNVGRGATDVALFEQGVVVLRPEQQRLPAPRPSVEHRPTDADLADLEAALPYQPQRVAVALAGLRERAGWWGPGRAAGWADAIEAARLVAAEAGVTLEVVAGTDPPYHPGRCALLRRDGAVVGVAGELHPRVVEAYALPPRSAAMEMDLDALGVPGPVAGPHVSTFPAASLDVAVIVDADVPAAAVEAALRAGAGDLLEGLRLFDVYTGPQVGEGRRSLAYALRLRAPDRTLTGEETHAVLDAAVAEAARRTGARLRD